MKDKPTFKFFSPCQRVPRRERLQRWAWGSRASDVPTGGPVRCQSAPLRIPVRPRASWRAPICVQANLQPATWPDHLNTHAETVSPHDADDLFTYCMMIHLFMIIYQDVLQILKVKTDVKCVSKMLAHYHFKPPFLLYPKLLFWWWRFINL